MEIRIHTDQYSADWLNALVEEKLKSREGEYTLFAQYMGMPQPETDFASYQEEVWAYVKARHKQRLEDLNQPVPPGAITLKTWDYGFTDARDIEGLDTAARDQAVIALQSYRYHFLTAAQWRIALDPDDAPDKWLAYASQAQAAGHWLEANIAHARACWLAPQNGPDQLAGYARKTPLPEDLPQAIRVQPAATYRTEEFLRRHWLAWSWKNSYLLDLPSLIAWSCDENFSVRTRIYRSLGQKPHPAAIAILREGLWDPHYFARAQAVRALGWIGDPGAWTQIQEMAEHDPHPEVQRSARLALQRIVGMWMYFGEWNTLTSDPKAGMRAFRDLIAAGLPTFAWEMSDLLGMETEITDPHEMKNWEARLEPFELGPPRFKGNGPNPRDYHAHFEEAYQIEADIRQHKNPGERSELEHLAQLELYLRMAKPAAKVILTLQVVSTYKLQNFIPLVRKLTGHSNPTIGFHARRTMRAMGLGTPDERRKSYAAAN